MEATGIYGEPAAEFLRDAGAHARRVNPARIKGFAQSELVRTKTDKADAGLIARFCAAMGPEAWVPHAAPACSGIAGFSAPFRVFGRYAATGTQSP